MPMFSPVCNIDGLMELVLAIPVNDARGEPSVISRRGVVPKAGGPRHLYPGLMRA